MFYYAPTSRCKIYSLATMRRTRVAFSSRPLMTVVNYLSHHMLYCITEDKYNVITSLSSYVIHWFKKTSYRGSCKLFRVSFHHSILGHLIYTSSRDLPESRWPSPESGAHLCLCVSVCVRRGRSTLSEGLRISSSDTKINQHGSKHYRINR